MIYKYTENAATELYRLHNHLAEPKKITSICTMSLAKPLTQKHSDKDRTEMQHHTTNQTPSED